MRPNSCSYFALVTIKVERGPLHTLAQSELHRVSENQVNILDTHLSVEL